MKNIKKYFTIGKMSPRYFTIGKMSPRIVLSVRKQAEIQRMTWLTWTADRKELIPDMREYSIAVIEGDGIGPEIVREAVSVLEAAGRKYGFHLNLTPVLLGGASIDRYGVPLTGGASIDRYGVPLTQETIEIAKKSDAVLMGSIGGDAKTSPWYRLEPSKRPEAGLLGIRKALGLFANEGSLPAEGGGCRQRL